MSSQIVFVGGGPVGLWTACQTKILNPETDVVVLEKHRTYERRHVLSLAHSAFSSALNDPRMQEVIQRFKNERPSGLFWKSSTISTSKIEDELVKLAKRLRIDVRKGVMVNEHTHFKKHFPNVKVVVGADGSHSRIRKIIDPQELRSNIQLNHIVELKYFAKGMAGRLNSFGPLSKISWTIGRFAEERIGGINDRGETPITLRFFVSEEEYLTIQDANFSNAYTIDKLPTDLRKKIEYCLEQRKEILGEVRSQGSEKVTAIPLKAYASRRFVRKEDGVTYCLVGDAAFGVPYFASANNGLRAGSKLAKKITSLMQNPQSDRIMNSYARYLRFFSAKEIGKAILKNLFLKTAEIPVMVSETIHKTTSVENIQNSQSFNCIRVLLNFVRGIFQKSIDCLWALNSKIPCATHIPHPFTSLNRFFRMEDLKEL